MEIECRFYDGDTTICTHCHETYVCDVIDIEGDALERYSSGSEAVLFAGRHNYGKTNEDVVWLDFRENPIGFVPKNLKKTFPNLKHLTMSNCGIEKLSREDLEGLEDLVYLDFSCNNLTSLPDDLFADMKDLEVIDFDENLFENIRSTFLAPIEHSLKRASFANRTGFNEYFSKDDENFKDFTLFKSTMDLSPPKSQAEKVFAEFSKCKRSGEFFDFTFKFRGKEFQIHKMIFAAQSSVFRKIFTDGLENTSNSISQLKNISEETFQSFLDYFYTGKVETSVDVMEMLDLASEFDVPELKIICTARILTQLDESNAVSIFILAHRNQSEELKQMSFKFVKKIFPGLEEAFVEKLDEVMKLVDLKIKRDAFQMEMDAIMGTEQVNHGN